jgi:hypothetical protein
VYTKSGRDLTVPKARVAMDSNNMYTVLREHTETADERTCFKGEIDPTPKAYDTPDIHESTCEDQGWTAVKTRASTRLDCGVAAFHEPSRMSLQQILSIQKSSMLRTIP